MACPWPVISCRLPIRHFSPARVEKIIPLRDFVYNLQRADAARAAHGRSDETRNQLSIDCSFISEEINLCSNDFWDRVK